MNSIEALKQEIERALPEVESKLRRPRKADGEWWLDVSLGGHDLAIQWSPSRGFGISSLGETGAGYGEGPEEVFESRELAAKRIISLLETKEHTAPPHDVLLRELRSLVGLTQEQLAERLGVQQAAVSRLERRSDVTLGSLRRYATAMGGQLEISMRTAAGERVRLLGASSSAAVRASESAAGKQSYRTAATRPKEAASISPVMNLIVLRVKNLERSREFYSLLGLSFVQEKHGKGPLHYSCTLSGLTMELYPSSKTSPVSPMRLGLRLAPRSNAIHSLVAAGFLDEAPPVLRSQPDADIFLVKDPDENAIELSVDQ